MPQINVKLFASLQPFMPDGAVNGEVAVDCGDDTTVTSLLTGLNVPLEKCHLVILNGVFVPVDQRAGKALVEGDTIAVWPPVAGG